MCFSVLNQRLLHWPNLFEYEKVLLPSVLFLSLEKIPATSNGCLK